MICQKQQFENFDKLFLNRSAETFNYNDAIAASKTKEHEFVLYKIFGSKKSRII